MAGREVFVDTSRLYTLVDKKDSRHSAAQTVIERLVRARSMLVLSDYVVSEAVTLAAARSGAQVAVRVLDLIEQRAGLRLESVESQRFEATKQFFRRHADHAYSFTDCCSFVLMRELGMTAEVTNDRRFQRAEGVEHAAPCPHRVRT